PKGAKVDQSEPQLLALTYLIPRPMMNRTADTLMATIVALNWALSLMPMTRIAVITSAITNAGRLNPNSKPKTCGAPSRSWACWISSGERAERRILELVAA